MRVEIRPIERPTWHGKTGRENIKRPVAIQALVNSATGMYDTGLTPEEVEELEKKTGLRLDANFNPKEPHPFWDSFYVTLPNHTIILDTDNPLDYIKYKVLLASKFVANSVSEIQDYPEATHVIYNSKDDIKLKAKKVELKKEAYKRMLKMSRAEKNYIVTILTGKILDNMDDEALDVEIDKLIEDNPRQFIEFASRKKDYLFARALVVKGIQRRVLNEKVTGIYFQDHKIGSNIEDAANFLLDDRNQDFKAILIEKV